MESQVTKSVPEKALSQFYLRKLTFQTRFVVHQVGDGIAEQS